MRRLAAVFAASIVWALTIGGLAAQSGQPMSSDSSVAENSDSSTHPGASSPEQSRESPLDQTGTWDLSVWANEAVGNSAYGDVGDNYVSMAGLRTGYVFARPDLHGRLRGTLEYFFDVIPVFVLTKPQVTYGGGASPVGFKWNFTGRREPFVETSLGGIFTTRDVPPGNSSSFNFTVAARGGLSIRSDSRSAITANVGFWHLSNAHIGPTNPSLNALTFGIEYHWFRSKRVKESAQNRQP
jgi:hypothetical protein